MQGLARRMLQKALIAAKNRLRDQEILEPWRRSA
jgi:hypothetical protein